MTVDHSEREMNQDGQGTEANRPEGRFANYFEIGQNEFEFIWDFGQYHAGDQSPVFHTRIITGPEYAKALCDTLNSAINAFEEAYGPIREISNQPSMDRDIEH